MTSKGADRRRAKFWVANYKLLAWLSSRKATVRWVRRMLTAAFLAGIGLWFWFPVAGVLLMFAAALPLVLIMLAAGIALIVAEIAAVRNKADG
jgi:hypothetical protein